MNRFALFVGAAAMLTASIAFQQPQREQEPPPLPEYVSPPQSLVAGAAPTGDAAEDAHSTRKRSSKWPAVRAAHLKAHPECAACGQKDSLNVHHIVPFHLHPELELEPSNLITLCTDGPMHLNCHGIVGHIGDFKKSNPNVTEDAKRIRRMLSQEVK